MFKPQRFYSKRSVRPCVAGDSGVAGHNGDLCNDTKYSGKNYQNKGMTQSTNSWEKMEKNCTKTKLPMSKEKNPAYGRHQISLCVRLVAPIP